MASNSATGIASQQSIKAYVDSQVTAQDLDLTDGTTSIAIDLDSEALSVLGGTGVTSTASGNGVTLAIDSTVATLTGSQTLTNKSLTSPTLTGTAVVASLDISGDVDVDGTLETDALSINGTAITSTAAELNILDGKAFLDEDNLASDSATGIASQQSIKAYVDGLTTTSITATGALNSGSITSGFGNIDNGSSTITTTGAITGGSFVIGSADINENDLESIDGITAGTVAASKAVVVDANKDATGFRNITLTGELDAGSLDVSGNVDVDGTLETDALSINGTVVTSTAAELNILDGVTSTAVELNALDGITAVVGELNALDLGSTATGTAIASKAVVIDANKDYTGIRNFSITGNLSVGGTTTVVDTVTMNAQNAVLFEGATADAHETTLTIVDPTADRTISLPNQSGTVPVLAASSNTAITSTPEELNILDGVTATATELNILDGVTATTAELNIIDGVTATTAELNILDGVTSTATELNILDGVTSTTAELNILDGVTSTATELNILDGKAFLDEDNFASNSATGIASQQSIKAYVDGITATNITSTGALNSGSITSGFGNINTGSSTITTTGLISGGSLDIDNVLINGTTIGHTDDTDLITLANGVVTVAGEVSMTTLDIGGTNVTSTAAELNILDGVTSTTAELNILDGVTSTATELNLLDGVTATTAELNILDGVTSTATELNLLDGVTSTTAELNILDGVTATAAELNILDVNNSTIGDLSEISTVANDDVFLAIDTSGGGLKRLTRSAIVSGLATSSALSNVVEDTTPQLGGNLDVLARTITTSTTNGNIALTPNGTGVVMIDGNVGIDTGKIDLKNGGTASQILFYCESSNAHAQTLQGAPHSQSATNTLLLPDGENGTLLSTVSVATLTNKTLTSPKINEDVAVTSTATELNLLDGVTATTAELNILDGVTSTAAELNILDGVTSTTAELNILDGVTSTAAELNILDGATVVVGEINALDLGTTAVGTAIASKAVILDSNKDYTGIRNLTISGEIDAATGDFSGNVDVDGTLEADAITVNGTALATVIAGTTVTNATNSAHVLVTDNESTNEENLIAFVEGATSTTGNVGLEMDGNFAYNPSSGTVSATVFKGNIDAVDGDFDGTLEADTLSLNGTTVTSTAAELNILDGVTSTATELNLLDGVTSTTAELNILDGVTSTAAELNALDGITAVVGELNALDLGTTAVGTAIASKAMVLDSNKDYTGVRNFTLSGELDAGSLDISGNVDIDGTLETDALSINGTAVTSTAAELNLLDGVTSTTAELNALDGITAVVGELNALDLGSTAVGTAIASKAVVLDSNKDYTGVRNFSITGNLSVGGTTTVVDTVTMNAQNAVLFEGATADAHETTLTIVDPTADRTINLPNQSGTVALLAAASNTAVTSTPEELNILDGVTSTTAELNILDGVTSTTAELNILDGVTSTAAELNILDGVTTTAAEINLIDGGTARGTTAVADGDGVLINDGGTMRMTKVDTLSTYMSGKSVGGANIVTTGALNSGTITSGFGTIDTGSSTITTTGTVATGAITAGGNLTRGGTVILDGSITDTGDFTIDVAGDIILDADGGDVRLADAGTQFARLSDGDEFTISAMGTDKDIKFAGNDGGSAITALTLDMSDAGTAIFNHDVKLGDNSKAIFGAGSDLQIYHDGDNSYITDSGTGQLYIRGAAATHLESANGLKKYARFVDGAAAELFYNNAEKLATTSTGIAVTGNIANTSGDFTLDVAGDIILDADGGDIKLKDAGTQFASFTNNSGSLSIVAVGADNDIRFFGNDGGASVTALTLDMSEAGAATFNNKIIATELDISGNADIDGTLEADAITVNGTALAEVISDTVGAMVSSNTESGITVTYQDADNTLDFTVGTLNQNTTGSAATLTTARAIAVAGDVTGTANFDGSAGISITTTLATNAIVTANITDGNITQAKMAANSIDSAQYVDGSIDTAHYAADSINTNKIADNAINSRHYVDGSIDQVHLANAIVNEAKMQISNAPTNGYFLSAQSGNTGGLTWAQAGSSTDAGAVGTYTWLYHNNNTLSAGATVSGSTLRDHNTNDYAATHNHWNSSSVLYNYGTWRNMTGDTGYANATYGSPSLFVRVS